MSSDGLGEFTGRGAATHRLRSCFQANWLERYLIECAFKSSRVTNSRTEVCVASRSIGAARLCSSADFQRVTQTHHLSPGLSPGNPHSGTGVTRSLPSSTEKSKNSRVTFTQTVCKPTSSGPVRQKPSRKNPVIGSRQQHLSSVPRTFVGMTSPVLTQMNRFRDFYLMPSFSPSP